MILAPSALSIEEYHSSAPSWLSKTTLTDFQKHGPKRWKLYHLDRTLPRPRPGGADQGLALDCLLTEGRETFDRLYPEVPADAPKRPDKRQLTAKKPSPESVFAIKWWDEWNAVHPGARHLSDEDRAILRDAADAVRELPAWKLIEKAKAQHSVRRRSDAIGLGLQARPDWLALEQGVLWDLKTTSLWPTFGKQAIDLGYHLQAAIAGWCLAGDGIALEKAYLVAVEWERGARARIYEIPQEALIAGDRAMRKTAAELADRLHRGDWTDIQAEPQPLEIPAWMGAKLEAEAARA